ncbi:acyltransferase family protein [Streptomyces sp. NPDC059740]|uniref:acyltransferase family protein n=1 Tax=Streptomyces sp. NPDC059740 TaxID=3346926 RepID=UPI00364E5F6B
MTLQATPTTPVIAEPVRGGPAVTARPAPARLRALDGLRLLAALMVALYHYGGRDGEIAQAWGGSPAGQFPTASSYFAYGCLGVQVFFVISGFVICMSGWGRTVRAFAASRFSRLFPAYWLAVLLVTAVFALPWVAYRAVSPSDLLTNLTMLQMPVGADRVLGVCWTLWAEGRFYLLFALCVVLPGANRSRVLMFCGGWTLASVLAQAGGSQTLQVVLMPQYAPFFVGGIGLYLVHRFGARDWSAWVVVGVSWLLGQHFVMADLWHPRTTHAFSYRSALGIIAVVTFGFVAVALVATRRLDRVNWRWLSVAGALTYPFYLIHEHLGWVAVGVLHQRLHLPSALTLPTCLALMLAAAWLIHRFVERPLTPRLRKALNPPVRPTR